jgi:hypothetical protein
VSKKNCTPALLKSWKAKQEAKKDNKPAKKVGAGGRGRGTPISIASSPAASGPYTPQSGMYTCSMLM